MMDAPAQPSDHVYQSKCDAWLRVLLWSAIAGTVAGAIATLIAPGAPLGRMAIAALLLASAGFVVWIMAGTRYTLTQESLLIRSGPFRWTVPLTAITGVTPTRNPLSSPALSLDRLHITYRGSIAGVMISPEPRSAFLHDLAGRTPGLRLDGDRLARTEQS